MTQELPPPKEVIDLRIEVKFKPIGKTKKINKSTRMVIQGMPYKVYIVVTNLSGKSFKGASLHDIVFSYLGISVNQTINHEVSIPAINPKSHVEIELSDASFDISGGGWVNLKLTPDSDTQQIQCHQYNPDHKNDEKFLGVNEWGISFFIEGKLAALQTRTNNYILALTIITVLEAVFGIKNMLIASVSSLARLFGSISDFFEYLSKLT
ncbi:hypothetical protein ACWLRU_004512 [Vibrio parahaemolyticus]